MAGKFSMPRFSQEDLDSTQDLPLLPEEFDPIQEDPIPDYDYPPAHAPQPEPPMEYTTKDLLPVDYDPDEEFPEDFIDVALRVLSDLPGFFSKHWKKFVLAGCAVVLLVLVSILGTFALKSRDPYDKKILNNVMIADVLVGGMTKEQAVAAVSANLASDYVNQVMTITLGSHVIKLDRDLVGAKLDVQAVVDAAYNHGRTGTQAEKDQAYQNSLSGNYVMAVLPYLELNEEYIQRTLDTIEAESVSQLAQPSYTLEGEVSDFGTEVFDPAASGQTLVITMGTPQVDFDADAVYEKVLDAYSLGIFQVEGRGPVTSQLPEAPDLDAIYQEFYRETVEHTLDMTSFQTIPGSYGREFDLAEARLQLAQAEYGQEIRIPMTYPAPEGDPASVLYRDVLGTWSTDAPADENWKQNIRLACKTINGITLKPGDTFSFNAVVGQPSEARGYVAAPICGTPELGGAVGEGLCQVASTLYVTALLAEQEITNRTAHTYPLTYTEWGLDAVAKWGGEDFSFRNSSIYPIRIDAELSGGTLKITLIGTDMRSYRTDMVVSVSETVQPKIIYEEFPHDNAEGYKDGDVIQEGKNGNQVKTYRCKYDKESGDLVARDYIATSTYPSQDKIIARVAPPVTETVAPIAPPSETISGVDSNVEAVG